MSEIKHAYRLMVIDIEEDKLVIDEFFDAIVAGVARENKEFEKSECNSIACCRVENIAVVAASVDAAEKAIEKQKGNIIEDISKIGVPKIIKKIFGIESGEEDDENA